MTPNRPEPSGWELMSALDRLTKMVEDISRSMVRMDYFNEFRKNYDATITDIRNDIRTNDLEIRTITDGIKRTIKDREEKIAEMELKQKADMRSRGFQMFMAFLAPTAVIILDRVFGR